MPKEIERKFLVIKEKWNSSENLKKKSIKQGYLSSEGAWTIRVRISDEHAFLTLKRNTGGMSRDEFEYGIPVEDAQQLLDSSSGNKIEKTRYLFPYAGKTWEVDEFHGMNEGLLMAEIELQSENEEFEKPEWVGKEVTDDQRYYNANLSASPFQSWKTPD